MLAFLKEPRAQDTDAKIESEYFIHTCVHRIKRDRFQSGFGYSDLDRDIQLKLIGGPHYKG